MKLADMEPVLTRIAAWDYSQARDPLYEFSGFLRAAVAAQSELPRIEARLLRLLEPRAAVTPAGRDYVCRELSVIGTAASVPALARLLTDRATAETARYTLARIPAPEAAGALRNALPAAPADVQAGIANALGERRDGKSVAALSRLLASSDAAVASAALAALARIGDKPALAAIDSAMPKSGPGREEFLRAWVRAADAVAAGGDKAAATRVYQRLIAPNEPAMIRIAALDGLQAADPKAALPVLSRELGSAGSDIQAAAMRLLNRVPDPEVTALFLKQYPGLSPIGQIRVLSALADRGDRAARPLVTAAVKSATAEVRASALAALGKLGDASSVSILAQAAANAPAGEQDAARESLAMLRGADVDTAVAAAIASSTGKIRLELIRAAGERASSESADVLMKTAQSSDAEAALAAIRALRNAASPEDAPALLDAVMKIGNATQRREAATTLASVIRQARTPAIGPVLTACLSSPDKPVKLTLLDVMGQVSAGEALPMLRASLKDPDPDVARAAILALTAWQTPAPLPDLLALAKTESNATRQILALRGFIKVLSVPSERSNDESVALLKQVWPLAKLQAEKRALLALLPLYPTPEALRMANAAVGDAAVSREAVSAADAIRDLGVETAVH
ncbi:MAG TPA: HEAT repeat domain-containing protein [Bryobacteraceae bacterium]|nr:HEAT repeat domain-containing protein [Bryobacteraceae bacterium]